MTPMLDKRERRIREQHQDIRQHQDIHQSRDIHQLQDTRQELGIR